ARISNFDAATVIEVIEHLDVERLATFERVLFGFAKPRNVILTTPNVEYNQKFENLSSGKLRHADHRFEWTRNELQTWARNVCEHYGYNVELRGIGDEDSELGTPTQMAVFTKQSSEVKRN
ncbi:MAG: 3' terminal RNA ribose 2'-O-methyltransferase Hen1, partial [Pyrinomonadaceae bacterium]|nr:3' terminal RNA ribose 2'-O-methyltransferase Hen1 [Pyrinomonadaceae bacterium]